MEKDRIVGVLREARGIRKNKAGKTVSREAAREGQGREDRGQGAERLGQNVLGQNVLGQKTLGQAKDASRGSAKEADRR